MIASTPKESCILDTKSDLWQELLNQHHHDIYHTPGYCETEAKRYNGLAEAILIKQGSCLFFVPYILRKCNDIFLDLNWQTEVCDISSPYGYSGILINESAASSQDFLCFAVTELQEILKSKSVCSAFLRLHPFLKENFANLLVDADNLFKFHGHTISIDLSLSPEQIWNQTKADRRNKINKCKRLGISAHMADFEAYIEIFVDIYIETMERVEARKNYLEFDINYCRMLKEKLVDHLHLCVVEAAGEVVSAGLYTEYNGIIQALFGGTRTDFVKLSPSSLETDFVRFWGKDRGNYILHLGGGLGGQKNSLYDFKSSFSKQRHPFYTMQFIVDEEKYLDLIEQKAKYSNIELQDLLNTNYFPAYRCPVG